MPRQEPRFDYVTTRDAVPRLHTREGILVGIQILRLLTATRGDEGVKDAAKIMQFLNAQFEVAPLSPKEPASKPAVEIPMSITAAKRMSYAKLAEVSTAHGVTLGTKEEMYQALRELQENK